MRTALSKMDNAGGSGPCWKAAYDVCDSKLEPTKACGEVIKIQSVPLNCNSEKVLYLLSCKIFDDTLL